ncbi:MAG: DUF2339 domain-containing protein [Peptococcaceae bacterium]|nr:DUF2339 domain-containing protein [Peptococcaceae bacterium]
MDTGGLNSLKTALDSLRDSHAAVESAFKAFEEQDLSKENTRLRETVEQLRAQLQQSRDETAALRGAHEGLIHNFKHELSSKRLALLGLSTRHHQAYLTAGLERERARIAALYGELQKIMDKRSAELHMLDTKEREPLCAEMVSLRERISEHARFAQERKEAAWRDMGNRQADMLNELKNSPVEDAALGAVRQFFAWETFLGLKIISAVGALLLLLGVFTFGRYLYMNMGPGLQCAVIFMFGLILMGIGEVFHQKKWRGGFTLALTAGGSGILFLGAALGYMTLGVLPMWAALGICAGVSLLSFAAALRYNAQVIAVFALIGGYLPIMVLEHPIVFFGAIYFTLLSLLVLLIAMRKNWRVARFFGLFAGLIAELMLMLAGLRKMPETETFAAIDTSVVAGVGAAIAIGFAAYLVIPVFGAWFTKTRIKAADVVLLSCNVFFGFLVGLWWATAYAPALIREWQGHTGVISALVAAFFAACCIVMAFAVERQKHSGVPESETGSLRALFFITSVTFSALIVLLALDSAWFSAGWLIEAAGLALYGIVKKRRRFNIAGLVIGGFCLLSFLFVNVANHTDPLFVWQYLLITLAAVVVSVAALKYTPQRPGVRVLLNIFRCAAALNLWGYMVYALFTPLMPMLKQGLGGSADSFAALLSITLALGLAFLLPRVRRVYNAGFQIAAIAAGMVGTLWLVWFNAGARGLADLANGNMAISGVVFVLYIMVNLIAVGWINDLLRYWSGLRKLPLGWYPLLLSGCAMLLTAQNLVVQMSLKASSLILTLLFGLTALGWVVFGFAKRNSVTRIAGLAMAFFAVIKLFVLDLHGLETTWRIASYFIAGIVLLAISFVYQWFNKRLETGDKKADGGSP